MEKRVEHRLVEILEYNEIGYAPVLSDRGFRVAVLNYHPELLMENISNFQKHKETDEIFVLLQGDCTLFLAEDETISTIQGIKMEPLKIYNVKKGTYHTHTLSRDGKVLIVEADDTSDENSPKVMVDDIIRKHLFEAYRKV